MDYKEKKEEHRGQWITVLTGLPFVIGITYFMYHAFDFGAAFNDPRTTFEEAIFGIVMMMVPGLFFGGFPAGYMMTEKIRPKVPSFYTKAHDGTGTSRSS